MTIPRTGRPGRTGIMVTKTLLWAGERGPLDTVDGQTGVVVPLVRQGHRRHRVGDADSGQRHERADDLHVGGKQYIVIAVAAVGKPAELLALALP